ncbi:basic proline-rich protein-like [Zonotrichia leucophrys gambelii]|uniref:basic proline-rich protein-like n=1 Tax=Zonotrichia leucophrys gambelii TaxID=257770 RepID=UPI0031403B29
MPAVPGRAGTGSSAAELGPRLARRSRGAGPGPARCPAPALIGARPPPAGNSPRAGTAPALIGPRGAAPPTRATPAPRRTYDARAAVRHKSEGPTAQERRREISLITNFHFPPKPRCQDPALQTCGGGKAPAGDAPGQRGRPPRGSPRSGAAPGAGGRARESPQPRGALSAPGRRYLPARTICSGGRAPALLGPARHVHGVPHARCHRSIPGGAARRWHRTCRGERRPRPGRGPGAPRHVLPAPSGAARGGAAEQSTVGNAVLHSKPQKRAKPPARPPFVPAATARDPSPPRGPGTPGSRERSAELHRGRLRTAAGGPFVPARRGSAAASRRRARARSGSPRPPPRPVPPSRPPPGPACTGPQRERARGSRGAPTAAAAAPPSAWCGSRPTAPSARARAPPARPPPHYNPQRAPRSPRMRTADPPPPPPPCARRARAPSPPPHAHRPRGGGARHPHPPPQHTHPSRPGGTPGDPQKTAPSPPAPDPPPRTAPSFGLSRRRLPGPLLVPREPAAVDRAGAGGPAVRRSRGPARGAGRAQRTPTGGWRPPAPRTALPPPRSPHRAPARGCPSQCASPSPGQPAPADTDCGGARQGCGRRCPANGSHRPRPPLPPAGGRRWRRPRAGPARGGPAGGFGGDGSEGSRMRDFEILGCGGCARPSWNQSHRSRHGHAWPQSLRATSAATGGNLGRFGVKSPEMTWRVLSRLSWALTVLLAALAVQPPWPPST